jgi:hypothetical protein
MTHLNGTTWAAFLAHLQRGGAYGYWWTLDEEKTYVITRGPRAGQREKCKHTYWWPVGKPLPIPSGATELVYFGVHPTRAIPQERTNKKTGEVYTPKPEYTRAEIAEIAAVNCLFAEFDAKDFAEGKIGALEHIAQLPVKPTVLIDSGGGYHCVLAARHADHHHRRQPRVRQGAPNPLGAVRRLRRRRERPRAGAARARAPGREGALCAELPDGRLRVCGL